MWISNKYFSLVNKCEPMCFLKMKHLTSEKKNLCSINFNILSKFFNLKLQSDSPLKLPPFIWKAYCSNPTALVIGLWKRLYHLYYIWVTLLFQIYFSIKKVKWDKIVGKLSSKGLLIKYKLWPRIRLRFLTIIKFLLIFNFLLKN